MSKPGNIYEQRKLAGLCVRCGAAALADSLYCEPHRDDARSRQAASARRRREKLRRAGRCGWCGRPSKTWACPTCRPSGAVNNAVDNLTSIPAAAGASSRKPNLAARTRKHADGRTRYHGRTRRGAPSKQQADEYDLRLIELELANARAALVHFHTDENQDKPKIQRLAALRQMLGHLGLMGRTLDDLVERLERQVR